MQRFDDRREGRWAIVMLVVVGTVGACSPPPEGVDARTPDAGDGGSEAVDTGGTTDTTTSEDSREATDAGRAGDAPADPDNLLDNPGFERGTSTTGCPTAWNCVTYGPGEAGQFGRTEDGRAGQYAAEWSGGGSPSVVLKQSQPAQPGRTYAVSVWVKSDGVSTPPFIEILFDGDDGEPLAEESIRPDGSTGEWTRITGTTSPAPSDTDSIRFNLSLEETGGTVWWDEASLVEKAMGGGTDAGMETDAGMDTGMETDSGTDAGHGVTVGGGRAYLAKRRSAGDETYCTPTGSVVETRSELLDALDTAGRGDVVYIDGGADIDLGSEEDIRISAGVTLASNRGCGGAKGGHLSTSNHPWPLFRTGADVTVFGIRLSGPRTDWDPYPGENSGEIGAGIKIQGEGVEIANSELSGFAHFAVQTEYDSRIHHNHIHHNSVDGLGYGVSTNGGHPVIEYNEMNHNRHSVAASGNGTGYTARYNVIGPDAISHIFDQHKPGGVTTRIHHNTVKAVEQADDNKNTPAVTIRGVPSDVASIHHNWIFNTESPCHSNDGWPGCAILQMHVDGWKRVDFHDNHFGESEPACDIGAPREGC